VRAARELLHADHARRRRAGRGLSGVHVLTQYVLFAWLTETTMPEITIAGPEDLGKAVEGRSDDEINKGLEGKYEATCQQVFDGMKERFMPEKAGSESVVIQYDVKAPDKVHTFQLKVAGGKCEVVKGSGGAPRVTLALSFPDFLRLVSNKLDGMQAFFSGKLKLTGDMMFAQTMQGWFKRT
jgi:putative sterol carrier protein